MFYALKIARFLTNNFRNKEKSCNILTNNKIKLEKISILLLLLIIVIKARRPLLYILVLI